MRQIRKASTSSLRMPHILIIEDNPLVQEVLQLMFNNLDCTSSIANTGQQAVSMFDVNHCDVVFTDVTLPDMCGVALIKQLRQLRNKTGLRIIAMTAHLSEEVKESCLNAGADAVSTKEELTKNIKKYIFGNN